MSYETRKLTEIEFPMYFSLGLNPGYNISFLETCGIDGEWQMFSGYYIENTDTGVTWGWGNVNHSIEGKLESVLI